MKNHPCLDSLLAAAVLLLAAKPAVHAGPLDSWTARNSPTTQPLTMIAAGTTNYVAVGYNGTVISSPDGALWTTRNSGTSQILTSVAFGNGLYVAVGGVILTSPDGATWTSRSNSLPSQAETVAFLNGQFFAIGDNGLMLVSSDGTTWSSRSAGVAVNLYGITYGNGIYVLTGAGGLIRTSYDGLSWATQASGTSQDMNGVTYGNGLFVIEGNDLILSSPTGTNWTVRWTASNVGLATGAFALGTFVVVGVSGTILTSFDGLTWTARNSGTSVVLLGVTFARTATNGTFVVVGDVGTILQSGPVSAFLSITCFSDKNIDCSVGWTFGVPSANANCGTPTVTIVSTVTNTAGYCGQTFDATRTWQANDGCGNTVMCSQKVTVVDMTDPIIICSGNITNECTGTNGAVVTFSTTAIHACDPNPAVVCAPASGSTFPLGVTAVHCTATDGCGNNGACSFTVTVADTVPPVITCPKDRVFGNGPPGPVECGTAWTFDQPAAIDACDGTNVTINILSTTTNYQQSCGMTFVPFYNRIWVASDSHGNRASCSQAVAFWDTTPPVISCSGNITNNCTSTNGAVVTFSTTATDTCTPNPAVVCSPTSGSTFALGVTTVNCTATDACGNTAMCSFTVTIKDSTAGTLHLTIAQSGANVAISWPQTCTTYAVERSSNLVNWADAPGTVLPVGSNYQFTNAATGTFFYRLHH